MSPALLLWAAGLTFAQDCPATIPETITLLEAEASRLAADHQPLWTRVKVARLR